jgi:hypothetical protein
VRGDGKHGMRSIEPHLDVPRSAAPFRGFCYSGSSTRSSAVASLRALLRRTSGASTEYRKSQNPSRYLCSKWPRLRFPDPHNPKCQSNSMKTSSSIAALAVAFGIVFSVSASGQKDPNFTPPGTEELAAVEKANATIDAVYAQLRKKLGPEESKACKKRSAPGSSGATPKPILSRAWEAASDTAARFASISQTRN